MRLVDNGWTSCQYFDHTKFSIGVVFNKYLLWSFSVAVRTVSEFVCLPPGPKGRLKLTPGPMLMSSTV